MHLHKHPFYGWIECGISSNTLQTSHDYSVYLIADCGVIRPYSQSFIYFMRGCCIITGLMHKVCCVLGSSSAAFQIQPSVFPRDAHKTPACTSLTHTNTHTRFTFLKTCVWKASPDVVVLAEDHAAFAVAGTAVLAQLSVAAGALEAARVPVPLHREEQEAVRDTTPTSCTRPARCPAAAHHRYCGCLHPAVHHRHWRVKGKRNHWRLDIKKVSKMRPNKSVSVMLTPNLRLRLTF